MSFLDWAFPAFLLAFAIVYLPLRQRVDWRNRVIVLFSLTFYGWWDWRFVALLVFTTVLDWLVGRAVEAEGDPVARRWLVTASVTTNLAVLGVCKYFDFFAQSFSALLIQIGMQPDLPTLRFILPLGISFYTFHSIGYVVDIYRGRLKAERDLVTYAAFITFFPQLVAGPIVRGGDMLPQYRRPVTTNRADIVEAVWLIAYGYFLKVAIGDPAGFLSDGVSFHPAQSSGSYVVLGAIAFGVQIYADFNGYSLIARGIGLLFGIRLIYNFNQPYVATSIQDFWRRWHISLSTWLRDYLYISLGGNRGGRVRTHLNLLVTMALGGLWHGASINFLIWGIWHGLALSVHRMWRDAGGRLEAWPFGPMLGWVLTLIVVGFGWVLFRSTDPDVLTAMLTALRHWDWSADHWRYVRVLATLIAPVAAIEWWQWRRQSLTAPLNWSIWTRGVAAGAMAFMVFVMLGAGSSGFIYFQF